MLKIEIGMKTHFLCLFIYLATLSIISCSSTGRNAGDINVYSTAQDAKLGAYWANYVQQKMPMLFDERLVTFVDSLGQKIVKQFPEDRLFDYQFKVIKDPQVNAFALPGGHIYVNLGLLQAVETEAELAGVLGHEAGHVVFRHGTEQLTKAQGWSCCLSIGSAALGLGSAEVDVINLFGQTGLLYYGRSAELEADQFGVEALHKSNYDVNYMANFFQILLKIQTGKPSLLDKMLSTHPPTEDRIKQAKEEVKKYPKQTHPVVSTPEFSEMKKTLEKYPNQYKKTELRQGLRAFLEKHSGNAP